LSISLKKKVIASAAIGAATFALTAPAGATALPNDLRALNCTNYKVSATEKVQACTTPEWANSDHTAIGAGADVTAYKSVKLHGVKQWVQDDTVQVEANTVQLFVDGQAELGAGYPSGPLNGYASSSARGEYDLASGTSYDVFSKGTLSLWQNGVQTHTINVQSNTVTVSGQ
jgi:hypothetical protein